MICIECGFISNDEADFTYFPQGHDNPLCQDCTNDGFL